MKRILLPFAFCLLPCVVDAAAPARATITQPAVSRTATTARKSMPLLGPARTAQTITTARTATTGARTAQTRNQQSTVRNSVRSATTSARSASPQSPMPNARVVRSATTSARSASPQFPMPNSRVVRSAARATAVFTDISKMGAGYNTCREAYNTCMDQFCAGANDTFRRCYCSSKFTEFKDTQAALDEAKQMLLRFEDTNLDSVDKTAAEVSAMYTATVGENAIKSDPSAAQATLTEIADLLSGKKKASTSSLGGGLDLSAANARLFDVDLADVWSGGGGNSLFDNAAPDPTDLEGVELYNLAASQCTNVIAGSCENAATTTMAQSAYNVLITQDCNAYEKTVETERELVLETVRMAEKYLREARLEEYRSHNSADVNECISTVKDAILNPNVCGPNYMKCLDLGTGLYIDGATGEALGTARLQDLPSLIRLDDVADILTGNPDFVSFMDSKRIYAETALDTCRDLADTVWTEFKRSSLIEIAQAQDEKLEEFKDECVGIMKKCYDDNSQGLADMDDTTAQAAGAISAHAARQMCQNEVAACAAVYAPAGAEPCRFDSNGKLTNPGCGLEILQRFVSTVDNVKVAEGCAVGLTNYVKSICTPSDNDKDHQSPYRCRLQSADAIRDSLENFAATNCAAAPDTPYTDLIASNPTVGTMITDTLERIMEDIEYVLYEECDKAAGVWKELEQIEITDKPEEAFYKTVYNSTLPTLGNGTAGDNDAAGASWGACVQNTVMYQCWSQADYICPDTETCATFNAARNTCEFTTEWYTVKCAEIGGYFENGVCYK